MSNISKGYLNVEGSTLHMSMPFGKVDAKKRTVSGYATLDNVDTQGDIVLATASKKAFHRARGNLREMHKKDSAVGRIVNFREEKIFDESGNEFNGIFVTARVSEGAQDTWLKVLDGTLSGFSIGGEINEASNEFSKDANRTVRVISDYDLTELSLVDNPANQLANVSGFEKSVFSMNKSADGSVKSISGMVAETQIENVFICPADDTIVVNTDESSLCPVCEQKMDNPGWFENGESRTEKVRQIVSQYRVTGETEAPDIANSEGGVNMSKKEENGTTTVQPNPVAAPPPPADSPDEVEQAAVPAEDVDETGGNETEKSADVVEVHDDESEIYKKIEELHDTVKSTLENSKNETLEHVASLEKKIDEINLVFEKKASELETKICEFGEKLEVAKGRLSSFEKSLDAINSSDAFRKSADLDEPAETVQKNGTVWNGTFSHSSLFKS